MSYISKFLNIYSTSPATVFSDLEDAIYEFEDKENLKDKIFKLHYELVLKDLQNFYLKKLVKKLSISHNRWTTLMNSF
jgi:hypothetical protein